MAEAAAGYMAYEVLETAVEIGVGAYFVAVPTAPLKAKMTQIASSIDDATRLSLARSDHTLSVVGSKAYIFGGETASGKLASNDIHAFGLEPTKKLEPEYSVIPAVSKTAGNVPVARTRHASCAFNTCVAIYGGIDETGQTIDDQATIWLFHADYQYWETLNALNAAHSPKARSGASLFEYQNNLILYGGRDAEGTSLRDTWILNVKDNLWAQLPDAPVSTRNAAVSDGVLHLIAGNDSMSSDLHFLPLTVKSEDAQWYTVPFPTNPLTPGPLPRVGAGLLPVSTGYGRQYLLYLFGVQPNIPASTSEPVQVIASGESDKAALPIQWSDMWTYQLPSSTPKWSLSHEAMKPAKVKDAIRDGLGVDSGKHSWYQVEVLPPGDLLPPAGKVHPGPRSSFACDVMKDKRSVVIWGGVNPKGEREGDGWVIRLE